MRLPFFGLVVGTSLVAFGVFSFSACSSSDPRPDAGDTNISSSSGGTSTSGSSSGDPVVVDSGVDAADAEAEPPTCNNTIRDGNETDVDCGGNVCKKCFDGKTCVANTDCAGGACLNNVCVTPQCTDKATNGDETDVDCGGKLCARCTTGKRCKANADCVSNTCDLNKQACACPAGMTETSKQGGNGAYCVDSFEVSKYLYNKFITANVNINDQISVCKSANASFIPRNAWPPIESGTPAKQVPAGGLQSFNYSLPVHYVDWCDAYAYCKWANKQLCGSVSGGSVAPDMADSADAGAWYNACSAQGANLYPYNATTFDNRCNGEFHDGDGGGPIQNQMSGYGFAINKDEGVQQLHNGDLNGNYNTVYFANCAGGVTGLYQMSGNVGEWEDSCDGTNPDSKCRVRGGSFFAQGDPTALSCKGMRTEQRIPPVSADPDTDVTRDIGFRCCLY